MPVYSTPKNPNSPFASIRGDHSGFRVPNMAEAIAWFEKTFDFRVVGSSSAGDTFYTLVAPANDDTFRLELLTGPGQFERPGDADEEGFSLGKYGWNHVCFRVDSVDDAVAELKQRGVGMILGPIDNPDLQLRVAFFTDPWGNLFELLQHKAG